MNTRKSPSLYMPTKYKGKVYMEPEVEKETLMNSEACPKGNRYLIQLISISSD